MAAWTRRVVVTCGDHRGGGRRHQRAPSLITPLITLLRPAEGIRGESCLVAGLHVSAARRRALHACAVASRSRKLCSPWKCRWLASVHAAFEPVHATIHTVVASEATTRQQCIRAATVSADPAALVSRSCNYPNPNPNPNPNLTQQRSCVALATRVTYSFFHCLSALALFSLHSSTPHCTLTPLNTNHSIHSFVDATQQVRRRNARDGGTRNKSVPALDSPFTSLGPFAGFGGSPTRQRAGIGRLVYHPAANPVAAVHAAVWSPAAATCVALGHTTKCGSRGVGYTRALDDPDAARRSPH